MGSFPFNFQVEPIWKCWTVNYAKIHYPKILLSPKNIAGCFWVDFIWHDISYDMLLGTKYMFRKLKHFASYFAIDVPEIKILFGFIAIQLQYTVYSSSSSFILIRDAVDKETVPGTLSTMRIFLVWDTNRVPYTCIFLCSAKYWHKIWKKLIYLFFKPSADYTTQNYWPTYTTRFYLLAISCCWM